MNKVPTQKLIKEMCGTVSFKRGQTFYRSNKVKFEISKTDYYEATIEGLEDIKIIVNRNEDGGFQTRCSCPTLASYQKKCQHVAAVLLAIYDEEARINNSLTNGIMDIFSEKPRRTSGHQRHFENRQVLDAEFTCQIDTQDMFGIKITVGSTPVLDIQTFLQDVKEGKKSLTLKYDPSIHCFQSDVDAVIQQLIDINSDEKITSTHKSVLKIPPSYWKKTIQLLSILPSIKLEHEEVIYNGFGISEEQLSLQFNLEEGIGGGYQLSVEGLQHMLVMTPYQCVVDEGKIFFLEDVDCKRLDSLKEMLEVSRTNEIPLPSNQIHFFLEKVLPGLKKLGTVEISETVSQQLIQTPLVAKLYLDKVKNRLLAGIEFHYDRLVINPLDTESEHSKIVRDLKKEEVILQLLEESSFTKTDEGLYLHNEELEYEFLYHVLPKLQKLVQVYATTAVRNRIFKGDFRPTIKVKVKKERTNWLEFKFEMDGIPEQQIRDLLQALEEKRKYYRLKNGALLSLETREFEEINRFLLSLPIEYEELEKGLNLPIGRAITFLDTIIDSKVITQEESFLKFLDEINNPTRFEVPANLEPILRDYQKRGFRWMKTLASYGFGGILADDMGLGKTLQSITFIQSVLSEIQEHKLPALIVCPSSLTYNWQGEIQKFAPNIQTMVIDGIQKERRELQKSVEDLDVIITSYTLLRKDLPWYEKQKFHTVFFDEAQAFKNPITQTARAVKKINATHRFALTGTPVENSIEELWSIFHVVFPELFQGLREYSHLSRKKIARRSRPFLLRRVKEDVLSELPEKIEAHEFVDLLPEQKKLYAAYLAKLRHDTLKHLDKDTIRKNRIKILAGLTRLRQICCHPSLFVDGYKGSSAKFNKLLQIIDEAEQSGRRVLIFSQFTKMLTLVGRELAKKNLPFFYLDGHTPSEERVDLCNRFNGGERNFFLISLKAGGTGLNLTGADTVILYDLWWNPAVEEQAADRAHRMGQERTVQVIKLIARGTIEEKMDDLQEKKRGLIDEIIQPSGEAYLTDEDIQDLLLMDFNGEVTSPH